MKNAFIAFVLSIVYSILCFLTNEYYFLQLIVIPLFIGCTSYALVNGKPLIKRMVSSLIPILSIPWIYLFLNLEDLYGMVLLHTVIVAMIVVQLFEILMSVLKYFQEKLTNKKEES